MMMQVALIRPQPVTENAPITVRIGTSVDTSSRSRKIELILAALSSFNSPFIKKDILSAPSFLKSVELIKRMSPSGKLVFAHTLLEGLLSEGNRTF